MKNKLRKKFTNTLRGRLFLWYLVSVIFIVAIFLLATGSLFWITLQDQIDHHVHITVNEAHQIVENYLGEERNRLIKNLVSAKGMTVIVLSPDGAPVLETNSPDIAVVTEHQLQETLSASSLLDSTPIHFTESNIRFAALPVQINAGKGLVAVGYSTDILYATFYKMIGVVMGVILFLVLPISYLGYKLLKRQLLPLESIAIQAKLITHTSSLSKRIFIESTTEELRSIQSAFNTMLLQLENIFKSERDFFSDAAHTLKTPLAVLRAQIESTFMARKSREEMLLTIDSVSDTIQDLLFLARIDNHSQRVVTFSLSRMMRDLVELATTLGEENKLRVASTIQKEIFVLTDKKLLLRALSNIIHNAVAYNRKGGSIEISLKKQAKFIKIVVQDTGIGIKKSEQKRLCERFFRGSNACGKGTGLGLAIAKTVIERMNGRLLITSSLHKGSKTTIFFPI